MQFLAALFSSPFWFLVFCAVYSPIWGSILACALDRTNHEESYFSRSHCRNCDRVLSALELIPIFSYLWLHGRCRGCGKRIDPTSLLFELIAAFLFPVCALKFGPTSEFLGIAIMLSVLIWLSARDAVMFSLSLGELGVLLCSSIISLLILRVEFLPQVLQAFFTASTFFVFSWFYQIVRGRIGFGIADSIGIFCLAMNITGGVFGILRFLLISLFGALAAICMVYWKRGVFQTKIPFIPFLAVGWLMTILMNGTWWFLGVKNWSTILIF